MAEAVIPAAVPMLLIERCRDPLMWYSGLVGQLVDNLGMYPEGDWSIIEFGLGGYVVGRSVEKTAPSIAGALRR